MFRIIPLLPRGVNRPARQKRALERIEKALLADALRLRALFAVFSRLTRGDAMPGRSGWRQDRGIRCDRPRVAARDRQHGSQKMTLHYRWNFPWTEKARIVKIVAPDPGRVHPRNPRRHGRVRIFFAPDNYFRCSWDAADNGALSWLSPPFGPTHVNRGALRPATPPLSVAVTGSGHNGANPACAGDPS